MVAIQQRARWKEEAILRSESITDAWEVTKIYAGRLAEWVLFLCMIASIVEILPGVHCWTWLTNTILGVQAVTLDIAGFGLATMAEQARLTGETKAARTARSTAYLLIGLMMVTVLSLSIGTLWQEAKPSTDMADKVLLLIRVVMTVVYGHVLHDLRQDSRSTVMPMPIIEQQMEQLTHRVATLRMPEPVNYETLAAQIVPLLPHPELPDYEAMLMAVLSDMSQLQTQKEQAVAHALEALQATVERFVDEQMKGSEPQPGAPIHLKVVHPSPKDSETMSEKQTFIRRYLSEYPEASISTIVKAAKEKGIILSQGYVSEQRKVFQREAS